ncbi:MAG: hypothetical protein QW292_08915 [Candidatus Parvarchaeota archaeon]
MSIGDRKNILFIGDLNLRNGGAQKITFETIEFLTKKFNIIIYSLGEPDLGFKSLIQNLRIDAYFHRYVNSDLVKN